MVRFPLVWPSDTHLVPGALLWAGGESLYNQTTHLMFTMTKINSNPTFFPFPFSLGVVVL